jgi:hypothetical protein
MNSRESQDCKLARVRNLPPRDARKLLDLEAAIEAAVAVEVPVAKKNVTKAL